MSLNGEGDGNKNEDTELTELKDEDEAHMEQLIDTELIDFDHPAQSVILSPNTNIRQRKKMLHTLSSLSITTTTSENNSYTDAAFRNNEEIDDDTSATNDDPDDDAFSDFSDTVDGDDDDYKDTDRLRPTPMLYRPKALSASILGTYDPYSNLRRRRAASSPRDIDSFFFQSEVDFHCDVYDDSAPDTDTVLLIAEDDSVTTSSTLAGNAYKLVSSTSSADLHLSSLKTSAPVVARTDRTDGNHQLLDVNTIRKQNKMSFSSQGDHGKSTKSPIRVLLSPRGGRDKKRGTDSMSNSRGGVDVEYIPPQESQKEIMKDIAIFMTSGILSSITYELLLKLDSNTALVSSFFLHLYIVLFSSSKAVVYLFSSKIPLEKHMVIVLLSFSFIYFKSLAIPLLPMPVFIVCTNLQLVVGLFVGIFLFGKTFISLQYVGVGLITLGCLIITLVSTTPSPGVAEGEKEGEGGGSGASSGDMLLGFCYMMCSIMCLSILIPTGSRYVQTYNADVQEHIFIQHFLALPLFLMHWETKIFPVLSSIVTWDSGDEVSEASFRGIVIPVLFSSHQIYVPIILIFLVSTTFFAQINRHYMIEVSIDTSSLMAQLIGTCNKTIVFLISSLYFNAPPYPPVAVWIGLCVQVLGSYLYVQASFSTTTNTKEGEPAFSFRPNTSTNRLSRVSWGGDALYDSNLLGLTPEDIAAIRKATTKHNNRVVLRNHQANKHHHPHTITGVSDCTHSMTVLGNTESGNSVQTQNSLGGSLPSNPLNVQRTVSEVTMPMSEPSDGCDNEENDSHHRLSLPLSPPLPSLRQRGQSADLL